MIAAQSRSQSVKHTQGVHASNKRRREKMQVNEEVK